MQPDGSGSETSPLPVTQSVGPGHIPLFIEHLLLGGTELGAALQHKRALASLSLGGLSYKIPPTPAHHPSRATARDGGGGVAVHTPGPCGCLASGSKLLPHLMVIKGTHRAVWRCGELVAGLPSCQEHLLGASGRIHRTSLSPGGSFSRLPFPRCAPERWGHPADLSSAWGVSEGMVGSVKGKGKRCRQFGQFPNTCRRVCFSVACPGNPARPAPTGRGAPFTQVARQEKA